MSSECSLMRIYGDCFREATVAATTVASEVGNQDYRLSNPFERVLLQTLPDVVTEAGLIFLCRYLSRKKIKSIESGLPCKSKAIFLKRGIVALPFVSAILKIVLFRHFIDRFQTNINQFAVDLIALTHIHEAGPLCDADNYPSVLETFSSQFNQNFERNLFYVKMKGLVQVISSLALAGAALFIAFNSRKISCQMVITLGLIFLCNGAIFAHGLFDIQKGTVPYRFENYENEIQACMKVME